MTQEEQEKYGEYLKKIYNDRDKLRAAEAAGEARVEQIGLEKGEQKLKEEKAVIARKLLQTGMEPENIREITGLLIEEIQALIKWN